MNYLCFYNESFESKYICFKNFQHLLLQNVRKICTFVKQTKTKRPETFEANLSKLRENFFFQIPLVLKTGSSKKKL